MSLEVLLDLGPNFSDLLFDSTNGPDKRQTAALLASLVRSLAISERACTQDVQTGRLEHRCYSDLRQFPDPQTLDAGDAVQVGHGTLDPGPVAIHVAESLGLLGGPAPGKPQGLGIIAQGGAALVAFHGTV